MGQAANQGSGFVALPEPYGVFGFLSDRFYVHQTSFSTLYSVAPDSFSDSVCYIRHRPIDIIEVV